MVAALGVSGAAPSIPHSPAGVHPDDVHKVYRIGLISYTPAAADMVRLKRALQKYGYFDGDTAVYMQRDGVRNGDPNSGAKQVLERDVADMVAWRPDVIVSFITTSSTAIAHNPQAAHIPVVMWGAEPVESKLAVSQRHPGLNFTGFASRHVDDLLTIRFLKAVIPDLKTMGLMYNGSYSNAPAEIVEMNEAGGLMGVAVRVYQVPRHEDFEPAIARMKADGMQAFKVAPHELFSVNGAEIGKLALKYGLPAVGGITVLRGGAIVSMGGARNFDEMAPLVDRVLHGAKPADTPFMRSAGAQTLVINPDALAQLHLTVPPSMRDEVVTLQEVANVPAPTQGAPPPGAGRAPPLVVPETPPLVITPARGTAMRVYRIALVAGEGERGMDELRDRLAQAGLQEGVDVVYLRRAASAVQDVVDFKPDLIVQMDTPAGVALRGNAAAAAIPIVGFSAYAVSAGQAQSYRHPGLNFTGAATSPVSGIFTLRLLKETIPRLARLAVIGDPGDPTHGEEFSRYADAGAITGVAVKAYAAPGGKVADALMGQISRDGMQAVVVGVHGPGVQGGQIGRMALHHRLAAVGSLDVLRGGGIASFGGGVAWQTLMPTIVRVLGGAAPGRIPIDRGSWPVMGVNVGAARQLGLVIPAHLVDDADVVQ